MRCDEHIRIHLHLANHEKYGTDTGGRLKEIISSVQRYLRAHGISLPKKKKLKVITYCKSGTGINRLWVYRRWLRYVFELFFAFIWTSGLIQQCFTTSHKNLLVSEIIYTVFITKRFEEVNPQIKCCWLVLLKC